MLDLLYITTGIQIGWGLMQCIVCVYSQSNSEQGGDRNFYLSAEVWLTPLLGVTHAFKGGVF